MREPKGAILLLNEIIETESGRDRPHQSTTTKKRDVSWTLKAALTMLHALKRDNDSPQRVLIFGPTLDGSPHIASPKQVEQSQEKAQQMMILLPRRRHALARFQVRTNMS